MPVATIKNDDATAGFAITSNTTLQGRYQISAITACGNTAGQVVVLNEGDLSDIRCYVSVNDTAFAASGSIPSKQEHVTYPIPIEVNNPQINLGGGIVRVLLAIRKV